MEDEPFQLKEADQPISQHKLFRDSDASLNISQAQFRFKDAQDWNSIYTSS